jgi:tetratricopeptide (TPR) repeat protein
MKNRQSFFLASLAALFALSAPVMAMQQENPLQSSAYLAAVNAANIEQDPAKKSKKYEDAANFLPDGSIEKDTVLWHAHRYAKQSKDKKRELELLKNIISVTKNETKKNIFKKQIVDLELEMQKGKDGMNQMPVKSPAVQQVAQQPAQQPKAPVVMEEKKQIPAGMNQMDVANKAQKLVQQADNLLAQYYESDKRELSEEASKLYTEAGYLFLGIGDPIQAVELFESAIHFTREPINKAMIYSKLGGLAKDKEKRKINFSSAMAYAIRSGNKDLVSEFAEQLARAASNDETKIKHLGQEKIDARESGDLDRVIQLQEKMEIDAMK